jgi:signal transduction histidine kinase
MFQARVLPRTDSSDMKDEKKNPTESSFFTSLLSFSDAYKTPELLAFKIRQTSLSAPAILIAVLCLVILRRAYVCFSDERSPVNLKIFLSFCILLLPPISLLYIYGVYSYKYTLSNRFRKTQLNTIGSVFLLVHAAMAGLGTILWSFEKNRDCEGNLCGGNDPEHVLPLRHILPNLLTSLILPIIFVGHDFWAVPMAVCITVGSSLISASMIHVAFYDSVAIAGSGIIVMLTVLNQERNMLAMSTAYSHFEVSTHENITIENEKKLMKMQTEELRHLIGNVAHDLRTPLQAFKSEMELMLGMINSAVANNGDCPIAHDLLESITQLNRICSFMHMSINRCIDYTKATSGKSHSLYVMLPNSLLLSLLLFWLLLLVRNC